MPVIFPVKSLKILGIDASNLNEGGGVTHLKGILSSFDPIKHHFDKLIIWGGDNLDQLEKQPWLEIRKPKELSGNILVKEYWKLFKFPNLVKTECGLLFSPGAGVSSKKLAYITMCRNMLVFDKTERNRYPKLSWSWIRLFLLKFIQSKSFRNAQGVIFLSEYAKNHVTKVARLEKYNEKFVIINHGVSQKFKSAPKTQRAISDYSVQKPFKLLYVSYIGIYKHNWNIAEAVALLRKQGFPVELQMVGAAPHKKELNRLNAIIEKYDPQETYLKYLGPVSHEKLSKYYKDADGFVYASTCENMPNIVIEAMTSGLPIASSNYDPMSEFLKDGAVYFDPTSVDSVHKSLKTFLEDASLRQSNSEKTAAYAMNYNWEKCTNLTFDFLYKKYMELHQIAPASKEVKSLSKY